MTLLMADKLVVIFHFRIFFYKKWLLPCFLFLVEYWKIFVDYHFCYDFLYFLVMAIYLSDYLHQTSNSLFCQTIMNKHERYSVQAEDWWYRRIFWKVIFLRHFSEISYFLFIEIQGILLLKISTLSLYISHFSNTITL